jgi:hypothetical protein
MKTDLEAAVYRPGAASDEQAWLDAPPSVSEYRSFLVTLRAALGDPVQPTPEGYRPTRRELRVLEREVLNRLAVRKAPAGVGG